MFELETNGFQFYAIANLDKDIRVLTSLELLAGSLQPAFDIAVLPGPTIR